MSPLSDADVALLRDARRAVLATTAADGAARLVPITFAYAGTATEPVLYSPLDDKAKSVSDPRELARVRDIDERPRVSILVDHWSEDWTDLAWLRLQGSARLLEPHEEAAEHARAVALLRAKYTQYSSHALELRPVIRIAVEAARGWRQTP